MQQINIRFNAQTDFAGATREVERLRAELLKLQAAAESVTKNSAHLSPAAYEKQLADLRSYQNTMSQMLSATGKFGVQQMEIQSATSAFTDKLIKQKVALKDLRNNWKLVGDTMKEQMQIQRMSAISISRSGTGTLRADVIIPKDLGTRTATIRQQIGFYNQILKSVSTNTINWGKNTQWAGRQLTAGISMPLIMAGAAMAKAFYDIDNQLTRIKKVYDSELGPDATNAQKTAEMAKVRTDALNLATQAAQRYGVAAKDTLSVEADLAATGMKGNALIKNTAEVTRLMTLGEIDSTTATKTIVSMQNVWKMSTDEVTKSINYMNAVENGTSLATKDFSEAIPRVASALAPLGVSLEQIGVLLVAMKERGIEASQGANALKTAQVRLINPTTAAVNAFKKYGDLVAISNKNGGNLFKTLEDLSAAFKAAGASPYEISKTLSTIFGIQQSNRLIGAISGITDAMSGMGDQTSQTAKAYELMAQSATDSGAQAVLASNEIATQTQSASGRVKVAFASMQIELAKAGQPFLDLGATVLNFVTNLMKHFDKLSDGTKKTIAVVAGIAVAMGPIIMLAGLFTNAIGNIMRLTGFIIGVGAPFKVMTAQQKAASVFATQASDAFAVEADAMQKMRIEVERLTNSLNELNATNAETATINETIARANGAPVISGSKAKETAGIAGSVATTEAEIIAKKADDTKIAWGKIAKYGIGMGLVAASFTNMFGMSSNILSNMITIGSIAAMFWPQIKKGFTGLMAQVKTFATSIKATSMVSFTNFSNAEGWLGKASVAGGGLAKTLGSIFTSGGVWLAILAGIFVTITKINGATKKARDDVDAIKNSSQAWADALGYINTADDAAKNAAKNTKDNSTGVEAVAAAMKKSTPALAEQMQYLNSMDEKTGDLNKNQLLLNAAIEQGSKVRMSGGSVDDAVNAMKASLLLAGKSMPEINVMIAGKYDFTDADKAALDHVRSIATQMAAVYQNTVAKQSNWETFSRLFTGGQDLDASAGEAAKKTADDFYNAFITASNEQKPAVLKSFEDTLNQMDDLQTGKIIGRSSGKMAAAGISNYTTMMKAWNDAQSRTGNASDYFQSQFGISSDDIGTISHMIQAHKILAQTISGEDGPAIDDLNTVLAKYNSLATQANVVIDDSGNGIIGQAANAKMLAAQTKELAAENANMGDTFKITAANTDQVTKSLGNYGLALDDIQNYQKNVMQNTWSTTLDDYKTAFDKFQDNRVQSLKDANTKLDNETQDAHDKAMTRLDTDNKNEENALDKHWKNVLNKESKIYDKRLAYYDKQKKAVSDAIKHEQSAEKVRQAIFAAEEARIQRASEMFGKNIDLNTALNSGNTDEAARIANDMQASQQQWDTEDAGKSSQSASDKRIAAQQKKLDQLTKDEDKRTKKLQDQAAAEKKALADSLAAHKKYLEDKYQADKRATARDQAHQEKALQDRIDKIKKNFDDELNLQKITTPKSEAEMQKRLNDLGGQFGTYFKGLNTKGKGVAIELHTNLKEQMRAAAADLQNKIDWAKVGSTISSKMIKSAFGMSMEEFRHWMSTGKMEHAQHNTGYFGADLSTRTTWVPWTGETHHDGGQIGIQGSRKGYTGSMGVRERIVLAKQGEYMMNEDAVRHYGPDVMNAINQRQLPLLARHDGGPIDTGFAGAMVAGLVNSIRGVMGAAISGLTPTGTTATTGTLMGSLGTGMYGPGSYGGVALNATQLANAATILGVGRKMGASQRDLIVSIMTAMQESRLTNMSGGDRDSIGLFQQRPSQGWGSPAQVHDPTYAAHAFFTHLLALGGRNKLPLTLEAQAVQRSAYPYAYAQWEDLARAIVTGGGAINSSWGNPDSPGYTAANIVRASAAGLSWTQNKMVGPRFQNLIQSLVALGYHPSVVEGFNNRNIAGTGMKSNHSYGAAIDIDPSRNPRYSSGLGGPHAIPNAAGMLAGRFGLDWGGNYRNSKDYMHFEVAGAPASANIPALFKGGQIKYDNTIANLHRNEKVLTAPLSKTLEDGINKLDSGAGNTYYVDMHLHPDPGTDMNEFAKKVGRAMHTLDQNTGQSRIVGAGK